MATTTYAWTNESGFQMNPLVESGNQNSPAVAHMARGGYFAAWSGPGGDYLQARVVSESGVALGPEFGATSATAGDQTDASLAGLKNGGAILAFADYSTDAGGDIMGRMFKKDGAPVFLDFSLMDVDSDDSQPDVAALGDGGFAVAWCSDLGGGDLDVNARVFNADGSTRSAFIAVEDPVSTASSHPSVVALANGGFVVAWEEVPVSGGDIDVYFKRFDAFGLPLDENPIPAGGTPLALDQSDIQALALQDGGFAFAFRDNDWGTGSDEIDAIIFNADGTARTNAIFVNTDQRDGNQFAPALTQLSNGYILVAWTDSLELNYQLLDTEGNYVGGIAGVAGQVVEAEVVALGGGRVANVHQSLVSDGSGNSIFTFIDEVTRTTTGDGTNETLNGDALKDIMSGFGGKDRLNGFGGKDTLDGGAGADVIRGGGDKDQLIGGTGADRYAYSDVIQSRLGVGADIIKGFEDGSDLIDVADIDAKASTGGDQAFVFVAGGFTAEGQVRAIQSGSDRRAVQHVRHRHGRDGDRAKELHRDQHQRCRLRALSAVC